MEEQVEKIVGAISGLKSHPDGLIVSWRAAIEKAARQADIALYGPYGREETVHLRRVRTLKTLKGVDPELHRDLLAALAAFDAMTARGIEGQVAAWGAVMVAIWEAAAVLQPVADNSARVVGE